MLLLDPREDPYPRSVEIKHGLASSDSGTVEGEVRISHCYFLKHVLCNYTLQGFIGLRLVSKSVFMATAEVLLECCFMTIAQDSTDHSLLC